MSAPVVLQCFICGHDWPLETAWTKHGPKYVCEDGEACATRANHSRVSRRTNKRKLVVLSAASTPPDGETP